MVRCERWSSTIIRFILTDLPTGMLPRSATQAYALMFSVKSLAAALNFFDGGGLGEPKTHHRQPPLAVNALAVSSGACREQQHIARIEAESSKQEPAVRCATPRPPSAQPDFQRPDVIGVEWHWCPHRRPPSFASTWAWNLAAWSLGIVELEPQAISLPPLTFRIVVICGRYRWQRARG